MKNVLIIGAGKRVKGTILPALHCLRDKFYITGIFSRSSGISLENFNFKAVDLIIVAVTTDQVPHVLRKLSVYDTKHAALMLDTPVLSLKHIAAMRFFKNFKKVLASEDTIALPPFLLARSLIEKGSIGGIKNICFFHSGYKYHALASLKMLAGENRVTSIRNRKLYDKITVKEISFPSGIKASVFEPRDYERGKFIIEGEKGFITDYDHAGEHVFRIGYILKDGMYGGLTLNGDKVPGNETDRAYFLGASKDFPEKSLMNSMKVRGLMDLILAACETRSSFHYSPKAGIYDNLALMISEKGYFRDYR